MYRMRLMFVSKLGELIEACEVVEKTTGGRLEEFEKFDEENLLY